MEWLSSVAMYGLLFTGSVFLAIYLYFQRMYKTWERLNVPYLPPRFPFGNVSGVGITKSIAQALKEAYQQSSGKPYVGMYSFSSPCLLVRDPDTIRTLCVKEFMSFHDRGLYYNEKDDPLTAHLLHIGGSKWKKLREKLTPTFTSGKMKMMFPILSENSEILVDILQDKASKGEVIEVKEYAARFTTDIFASCAFGIRANSLTDPKADFRMIGKKIVEPTIENSMRGTIAAFWPELANLIKMIVVPKAVTNYFSATFRDTIQYRQQNNIKGKDFMQLLIQLMETGCIEDKDGKNNNVATGELGKLTFEEAAAEAFLFFLGGFETSATTMQFALYELALNPHIQDTLREEIFSVLEKHDNKVTYEAINEMKYSGRVIDETLRKYPPVPILFRACTKDFQLPETDVVIPAGTRILIPVVAIQNDEQYYPNPEKFDPDRFVQEEKSKRHHYTYLPFGEGPRMCIGMRFGLMQTRIGLISLLSKYRFEVAESTPIPMKFDKHSSFPCPEGGMNLKITKL